MKKNYTNNNIINNNNNTNNPQVFVHSKQLSLNKFFDPSTPSMRKGHDGGKKREKKRKDG